MMLVLTTAELVKSNLPIHIVKFVMVVRVTVREVRDSIGRRITLYRSKVIATSVAHEA